MYQLLQLYSRCCYCHSSFFLAVNQIHFSVYDPEIMCLFYIIKVVILSGSMNVQSYLRGEITFQLHFTSSVWMCIYF